MKLLIADDNFMSLRRIEKLTAKWGFETVCCSNGDEAFSALNSDPTLRLAVLDWNMPGIEGPEICKLVRSKVEDNYRYIILLTANDDEGSLIAGLEAGADDFIRKPFNVAEFQLRLRTGSRVIELQDRLLKTQEELREQANTDILTGLPNRRAILEQLEKYFVQSRTTSETYGVMMFDVDHFKTINDQNGHLVGDEVLRHLGSLIRAESRPIDTVGRFGGEEFLMLCPGVTRIEAASLAERIRDAVCRSCVKFQDIVIRQTLSIGVSVLDNETVSSEEIVRQCDEAMYYAKASGRNRYCTHQSADHLKCNSKLPATPHTNLNSDFRSRQRT